MSGAVLVIAGLDPSGGAGLLADTAVVLARGLFPLGIVTALTDQDSSACHSMHLTSVDLVSRQLRTVLADLPAGGLGAIKIGMLGSAEMGAAIADALRDVKTPLVLDPILSSSSGAVLGSIEAFAPLKGLTSVVTPNTDEISIMSDIIVHSMTEMRSAATRLRERGWRAVLGKGGHLDGDPCDLLLEEGGERVFANERIAGPVPHGTGCALSTEIACELALGRSLTDAVERARAHVRDRIARARKLGNGRPLLGYP